MLLQLHSLLYSIHCIVFIVPTKEISFGMVFIDFNRIAYFKWIVICFLRSELINFVVTCESSSILTLSNWFFMYSFDLKIDRIKFNIRIKREYWNFFEIVLLILLNSSWFKFGKHQTKVRQISYQFVLLVVVDIICIFQILNRSYKNLWLKFHYSQILVVYVCAMCLQKTCKFLA